MLLRFLSEPQNLNSSLQEFKLDQGREMQVTYCIINEKLHS